MISGLQHFCFCRRQWALIHIEQQWKENLRTTEGRILHERAHDETLKEIRGDRIVVRSLRVFSHELGLTGECDVVEFLRNERGIQLNGHDGMWMPHPVEYKRGSSKQNNCDRLQLCAQAMCLGEMLCCEVTEGSLYYGETHRRENVVFSQELREEVRTYAEEMHELYQRRRTPKAKRTKSCNACSLQAVCLPELTRKESVSDYIRSRLGEEL